MDVQRIRKKIIEGNYDFSAHAEEEWQVDKIMTNEIEKALLEKRKAFDSHVSIPVADYKKAIGA